MCQSTNLSIGQGNFYLGQVIRDDSEHTPGNVVKTSENVVKPR